MQTNLTVLETNSWNPRLSYLQDRAERLASEQDGRTIRFYLQDTSIHRYLEAKLRKLAICYQVRVYLGNEILTVSDDPRSQWATRRTSKTREHVVVVVTFPS